MVYLDDNDDENEKNRNKKRNEKTSKSDKKSKIGGNGEKKNCQKPKSPNVPSEEAFSLYMHHKNNSNISSNLATH